MEKVVKKKLKSRLNFIIDDIDIIDSKVTTLMLSDSINKKELNKLKKRNVYNLVGKIVIIVILLFCTYQGTNNDIIRSVVDIFSLLS